MYHWPQVSEVQGLLHITMELLCTWYLFAGPGFQVELLAAGHLQFFLGASCASCNNVLLSSICVERGDFLVVRFPEQDDEVAVVHTKWVHGNSCLWPPEKESRRLRELIKKGATPMSSWKKFKCVEMDGYPTYEKAQQKLRIAECTSDLQSENDLGRGKRKKITRQLSSSDSDEPEAQHGTQKQDTDSSEPPTPPRGREKRGAEKTWGKHTEKRKRNSALCHPASKAAHQTASQSQGSTMMHGPMGHKRNEEASNESQGSTMMHRAMGHKRNEEAFTGLDKQVIRILHTIRLRVEQHSMQLDTIMGILNSSGAMNVPNDEILEEPFDNVDDFLVNQLAAVGGSSVGNNTRGVLEQLMTQKVAVKFSWLGQREKMKFKDLEYPDVIYRAVKKNKRLETDKAEVWEVIKTWLKHAAEKLKKKQRKLQPDE
ncbi:uncharacterized protein LOC120844618 [Ixodes scapularis]|uniref:uncharacterized protein LOC120844618 n=1 Tax=Ixodes scapularis TaxID=6945 RepID=UPI001A9DA497|nr:uncharacterized protein LOC120844618 [Ixodes scapularis]